MLKRRQVVIAGAGGLLSLALGPPPVLAQRTVAANLALVAAARAQVGVTLTYDPAYTALAFPNGDVPHAKGVCTDVIIRAYRDAFQRDLQDLVNKDMRAAFGKYPTRWGLSRPDANIDHRRVLNLQVFLRRQGAELPHVDMFQFAAGDVVTQTVSRSLPHIGIVSDRKSATGEPLLIHNIGMGAREEVVLSHWPLTGRYRWFPS
jgi:uncharacterized protein